MQLNYYQSKMAQLQLQRIASYKFQETIHCIVVGAAIWPKLIIYASVWTQQNCDLHVCTGIFICKEIANKKENIIIIVTVASRKIWW